MRDEQGATPYEETEHATDATDTEHPAEVTDLPATDDTSDQASGETSDDGGQRRDPLTEVDGAWIKRKVAELGPLNQE
jgi:hypothetical protein